MRRLALLALLTLGCAFARPVALGGIITQPRIETETLPGGLEGLPVWFLPRLGIEVVNNAGDLRLRWGARELRFGAASGWTEAGRVQDLPAPELLGGSVHVSLYVLRALGLVVLSDAPEVLDFAAPATAALPAPTGTPSAAPSIPAPIPVPIPAPIPVPNPVPAPLAVPAVPVPPSAPPLGVPSAPLPQGAPFTPPANSTAVVPAVPTQLASLRASRTLNRAQETQRLVLEFSGPANYQLARDKRGLTLTLPGASEAPGFAARSGLAPLVPAAPPAEPGVGGPSATVGSAAPLFGKLASGDILTVTPTPGGLVVRLETGADGLSKLFTLADPHRIVIDTVTNLDPSVTPPPALDQLPPGVAYRQVGKLQLLSFDPALFTPKVVTAGVGSATSVFDLVKRVGGVAGVNGGYFDPRTSFPVDLVAQGGLMLSASLERRATLGFTDGDGVLFGFPRPRYSLAGDWGTLVVNTVRPQANPNWVTLFVGDGRTAVGAPGFVTLTLDGTAVTRAVGGPNVPGAGEIAVTFDPARFPQLPQESGAPLRLTLNWAAPGWEGVREALSAGPLLVDGGQYVLNALREGFDVKTNVWRPTRQVAFAVYAGRPTIAYFENGTPEEFARALVAVGASRAMRLDSGSSATVYVAGGYFNTVWSRPVPNAIVFVPKVGTAALEGGK